MQHYRLVSSLFLIVSFIFHSCATDVNIEETTGNLIGIVADKTTGEPVPVVNLVLTPGGKSTVTGSDGSFSFKELDEGKYSISYTKDGYKNGETVVTVAAGIDSEAHLLIERVPAVITVDRDILDFGDASGTSTLSFKIVNPGYETLMWSISYDKRCKWLKSVYDSAEEYSGKLASGKTETLIVTIDRDELAAGVNETVVVVTSNNGSSEIKIRAIGQEKISPSLNILNVENLSSTSVILHGEIVIPGTPSYTERGFVYSIDATPTIENTISRLSSPVSSENKFSYTLDRLTLGDVYNARAYAISKIDTVYSTNEIRFNTTASVPIFTTTAVTDVNIEKGSAVMNALIEFAGDPEYIERGFTYSEDNAPDIDDIKITASGSGTGEYHVKVNNLELDKEYFVRSYVRTPVDVYYGNEISFVTATSLAEVTLVNASDPNTIDGSVVFTADISNIGNPAYTERGFVYSLSNNPSVNDSKVIVEGSGAGEYSTKVSGLSLDREYHLRAYVINKAGISYSSNEVIFCIKTSPAEVEINDVSNKNTTDGSVVFNGSITYEGSPAYTERGFVYSLSNNPTINDNKIIIDGKGIGAYSTKVSGLELDRTYYLRSYAINASGTSYSKNEIPFCISTRLAEVSLGEVTNTETTDGSAMFNATITDVGDPAYYERGFVFGENSNPTVNDKKITATGESESGDYCATITGLTLDKAYYVKAYVINKKGISYSSQQNMFTISTTAPSVKISDITDLDLNNRSATIISNVISVGDPAYTERGVVYGLNNSPTSSSNVVLPVSGEGAGTYNAYITSLELRKSYYVWAYVISNGKTYYSEVKTFTLEPIAPVLTIAATSGKNYATKSITFNGSVTNAGTPSYTERGFVYGFNTYPTIDENKVVVPGNGTGDFSRVASNLIVNQKYYVRSYAIQDSKVFYSSGQKDFTITPTLPNCNTTSVTELSYTNKSARFTGTISSAGDPAYSEKGFVYGFSENPTIDDNVVRSSTTGTGEYHVVATGLETNKKYYVRSYAINDAGVGYGVNMEFTITPVTPGLYCSTPEMDKTSWECKLKGEVISVGEPPYYEIGFAYSNATQYPTTSDNAVKIDMSGIGEFSTVLKDLPEGYTYYVRVYAKTDEGITYSSRSSFSTTMTLPSVSTYSAENENPETGTATLKGKIQGNGDPVYTERGFVYSSEKAMPTIDNASKITAENSSSYSFSTEISGLSPKTFYYVRAYATNTKGTAYGEVIRILGPDYYTYSNLMVQRYDAGYYTWTGATKACADLVLAGYSDWRLPTLSELGTIGEQLTTFDEYSSSYYWSSTYYGTVSDTGVGTVKCYSIYNVVEKYTNYCEDHSWYTYPVRCVRSK